MSEHSESVYKNNCLKLPKRKKNKHLHHQLENQVRKLNIESDYDPTIRNDKQKLKSFLEFYDSIPEYDDINHLSNKDFYKKMDYLRERQRTFYECILTEAKYSDNIHSSWYDNYKSLNNSRNSIIKSKADEDLVQKPPSRRSVRIESPEVTPDSYRPKSRVQVSSADSTSRCKSIRKTSKSPYNESTLDEFSDCTLTTRSAPCSPRKQTVAWKDDNNHLDTPSTFKMTIRDEDDKIVDQVLIDNKQLDKSESNSEMFRANPVPIESRIPLFDRIMYEQEIRREHVKKQSKEALQSRMRLFSFTKREEEIADITRELSKSSPDLFMCVEKQKTRKFRAKPVPKNLFSNYAYQKMHEDEYYRSLQKKIRAEEMLKTASLPPSMAKREKTKPKYHICPKSFREMYESQLKKFPPSSRRDLLGKELAELELDFIMATPSPVCKPKEKKARKKKSRKSASSNSSKSSRSPSALESVNRSNLAAVLRIQNSRKRLEDEISRRLEEAQIKEEARWREKVLRKRPVWQTLAYSHEEDINMRLQMRRDEEKMRNEEYRVHMQSMLGRVNQQPTLFERQSNLRILKSRDDLISQLCADSLNDKYISKMYDDASRSSTSNTSMRKCIEMKDEGIQAKFDDLFNHCDHDGEGNIQKTSKELLNKNDSEPNFDEIH